jgi:hypothetical protein
MPEYSYGEGEYLKEIQKYVDGTYGEHYVAKDIQVVDIWESLGSLESTARDTAIKYLCRYGKKNGKNRKDLYKAIHYIMLMMHADDATNVNEQHQYNMFDIKPVKPIEDFLDAYDKVNFYDTHSGK